MIQQIYICNVIYNPPTIIVFTTSCLSTKDAYFTSAICYSIAYHMYNRLLVPLSSLMDLLHFESLTQTIHNMIPQPSFLKLRYLLQHLFNDVSLVACP